MSLLCSVEKRVENVDNFSTTDVSRGTLDVKMMLHAKIALQTFVFLISSNPTNKLLRKDEPR